MSARAIYSGLTRVHPRGPTACLNNDYENSIPLHQGQRTPKEDYTSFKKSESDGECRTHVSFEKRVYNFLFQNLYRGYAKGRLGGGGLLLPRLCLLLYSPQLKALVLASDGYQYQHSCEQNG